MSHIKFTKLIKYIEITFLVTTILGVAALFRPPVNAQDGFTLGQCENYYCPTLSEEPQDEGESVDVPANSGDCGADGNVSEEFNNYYCYYDFPEAGEVRKLAIPKPPQLRVIEFWIVRLIYAAWGVAGMFFTLVLMYIGFLYVTSFGNEVALATVVKRFRYWIIGMILVFLSYPILNTFFTILPIDTDQGCYDELEEQLIGFRFFFPEACGNSISEAFDSSVSTCSNVCENLSAQIGRNLACSSICENADAAARARTLSCIGGCDPQNSGTPNEICLAECISEAESFTGANCLDIGC